MVNLLLALGISRIPMIFFLGNSALACSIYTVCGQPLALAIPSSELQIRNSGPAECAERLNNNHPLHHQPTHNLQTDPNKVRVNP